LEEKKSPENEGNYTDADGKWLTIQESAETHQQQHISEYDVERSKYSWLHYPWHWIARGAKLLNSCEGLITALATVVMACFTYYLAVDSSGQRTAIEAQLEQMKAEQRAWLSLDIVSAKLDIFRNQLPDIDFEIAIKNVGKTPARGIIFQPQTQEPPRVGEYSKSIIENCPHTMPFTEEYGTFLVPEDRIVRRIPILTYMPAQIARAWSPPEERKKVFDMNAVICVWYQTTLDEATHITGAVIWIRKSTDEALPEYSIEAKYGD
jgi:hypothetical protein